MAYRWRSSSPPRAWRFSAPALIARWDSAVGLDARGARDLPKRQQTLRRAFDWSYELLGDEERALLRRLAAFPGGFDVAAVEAACAGDGGALPALAIEPIETLAGFVDRSLVSREPRGLHQPAALRPADDGPQLLARTARAPW